MQVQAYGRTRRQRKGRRSRVAWVPREYEWPCLVLAEPVGQPWGRFLLVRRSFEDPTQ